MSLFEPQTATDTSGCQPPNPEKGSRTAGEPIDRNEHAFGVVYEPGDRRRAATGHLIRSMMAHGMDPRPWIDMDDLPPNIAFMTVGEGRGARLRRAHGRLRAWLDSTARGRRHLH